ncbi:MAG: wax ester/triacylglycerol synthase family O-acyltransferase [Halioglobus sp.]
MKQLSGMDASFLYLELPNSPMHVGGLAIYDPATAPGGELGFKQILANIKSRSHLVSSMTDVLVEVPLRLDHPYWKSGGAFDPEFHVRHLALPRPGDWRQLCIMVSRIHARPLDLSRPLWEMYVIEGLDALENYPKGCFAILTKVHHASIDGATGTEITSIIHDTSPEPSRAADAGTIVVDRQPSGLELLLRAQLNSVRQPFHFFNVVRHTLPSMAKAVSGLSKGSLRRVTDIPRTRFNTSVSPYRVFDVASFQLDDIRRIKNSLELVTVNDVALTIVGGALRKYLESKNELPEESLVAMAPINVRTEDKKGTGGNQVSQMKVLLRSDIEDPKARLLAVNEGSRAAKELTEAIGAKTMTDYTKFTPSSLTATAARLASSMGIADRGTPIANCTVTNVPGPQIPLYFTGAKLLSNYGLGPAIDGGGLFHIVNSYCGEFSVSISCCRVMMPDPAFYANCIRESHDELLTATVGRARKAKNKMKKSRSR